MSHGGGFSPQRVHPAVPAVGEHKINCFNNSFINKLKALDTIGNYSKQLLAQKHTVGQYTTLWKMAPSKVCSFWEKGNFSIQNIWIEFETSAEVLNSKHLCDEGVFSSIILSQLKRPVEFKMSQVFYFMHMLRYTPKVSSTFKVNGQSIHSWIECTDQRLICCSHKSTLYSLT